ncbi:MAG TPA: putative toxin-antitoxin system toxin component, PIN family [Candidatus Nanoarchaeia archaeon]|nr:putative toxin-antitoxin system toxin component, PIN family [Candidatus Nanoarchaeia archaeon]
MRLILDTNVFVSGIFWEGNFCSQLIDKWKNKEIELLSSLEIVEELVKTLRNFKISIPQSMIEEWKNLILNNSILIQPSTKIDVIKEDPEDNKFLEAAVDGKADFIISQDKHLLNLKEYQGIKILKPEEALNLI